MSLRTIIGAMQIAASARFMGTPESRLDQAVIERLRTRPNGSWLANRYIGALKMKGSNASSLDDGVAILLSLAANPALLGDLQKPALGRLQDVWARRWS